MPDEFKDEVFRMLDRVEVGGLKLLSDSLNSGLPAFRMSFPSSEARLVEIPRWDVDTDKFVS
jgi:hypothetical protein